MSKDVSVIVPNLHSAVLGKTIQSLLEQQTTLSYEIIVVGQDKYGLGPEHPQVKRIYTENPTPPGKARNLGVGQSTGKLIVFVDSDCIVPSDFIDQHTQAHLKYANAIIGGSVEFPLEGYMQLCDNVSSFHEYMTHLPEGTRRVLPSLNMSISRVCWDVLRGFDETFPLPSGEDADFVLRAKQAGMQAIFFPSARVLHMHNRDSLESVLNHARNYGQYSSLMRSSAGIIPWLTRYPILLYVFSPLIALRSVLLMVFFEELPFKYYKTLPIVYLSKIVWCFGAANSRL